MKKAFPHVNFRREVTIGHLCLDYTSEIGNQAKVNPPIRSRADVEYLWEALLDRELDWVCSDHACCKEESKHGLQDNVFMAKSGFGGTEFMLPALITEGKPRGLSYNHMAELTSWAPARRFGLHSKGDLAPGFDADVVLVDPKKSFVASGKLSQSSQGFSVFEGMEMSATIDSTYLRGQLIWNNGKSVGPARGQYLHRPYSG
jgi:allantoinase